MSYQERVQFQSYERPRRFDIDDLDVVALIDDRVLEGRKFKAGTRGTVVAVYADGYAYDVEFNDYDGIVTVRHQDIGLVRRAD